MANILTSVKVMLDTVKLLTVRAMSEDLDISTLTAHKIVIIKKTCL